eukprot:5686872-Amphidinium_carterae.1
MLTLACCPSSLSKDLGDNCNMRVPSTRSASHLKWNFPARSEAPNAAHHARHHTAMPMKITQNRSILSNWTCSRHKKLM